VFVVAGLGNPGPKYAANRHNVGFMVIDRLAARLGGGAFRDKFNSAHLKTSRGGSEVVLLKPMTFMNLSGDAVQRALAFYKVAPDALLVVHDELDLPFADVRIKKGGGAGGHNGVKSLLDRLGGADFVRVRIGVGRPRGSRADSFVLSDFAPDERAELSGIVERAADAVERIVADGLVAAMNSFNVRPKEPKPPREPKEPKAPAGTRGAEEPKGAREPEDPAAG
jgi:PTH1 family peptidyl-tRNA hydrolase